MCNYLGAQQHHATTYPPLAQGQIERLNKTLKNSLRCQDNINEWYDQWWILGEANEAAASGPPFLELSRGPLLKMACLVLGYFVAF